MGNCQNCGYRLSQDANFCPNCGASLRKGQAQENPSEKSCPKCGAAMRAGFIVEKDSPLSIWTLGSGIYWTPGEAGVAGERVAVKAYACPECGYIEHYVRYLDKDRNTILGASTGFSP